MKNAPQAAERASSILRKVRQMPVDVYDRYEQVRKRVGECLANSGVEQATILDKWYRGVRWDVRLLCDVHGFGQKKVLDIGCAYGSSLLLWGEGSEGVEVNESCATLLLSMGTNVHGFNVEDGKWDEIPERSFEAVFSSNLVEHLVAPHLFFGNLYRVLEDDGVLAIQHPVVVPAVVSKLTRIVPPLQRLFGREGWHAGEHINFFTPRTVRLSLERAGFVVVEQYGGYFRSWPALGKSIVPVSAKCLSVCRKAENYRYSKKRIEAFDPGWARQLLRQYR